MVSDVIAAGNRFIDAMEQMSMADRAIRTTGFDAIIMNRNAGNE